MSTAAAHYQPPGLSLREGLERIRPILDAMEPRDRGDLLLFLTRPEHRARVVTRALAEPSRAGSPRLALVR